MPAYVELDTGHSLDPTAVIQSCVEAEVQAILLDTHGLPAEFFDLSSGFAGNLVNKLAQYQVRMAAVVPDISISTRPLSRHLLERPTGASWCASAPRAGTPLYG